MTPDDLIKRINEWLAATGTSVREAAERAGVAQNTAHLALKGRGGRIDTLRKLCALVPTDFHSSPHDAEAGGHERSSVCHDAEHNASEICEVPPPSVKCSRAA